MYTHMETLLKRGVELDFAPITHTAIGRWYAQRLNQVGLKRKERGDNKWKPDKYQRIDAKSPVYFRKI
uniref:Uncharacterized protein n=1 Tax=Romanomermis culicivorax TaxID=13658 RepID=A0A915KC37_ROMCU